MPTILPEGVPWWAWVIVALAVVITAPLAGVVQAFIQRPTKKNVEKIVEQTENSHAQTQYPNLRDELTAVRVLAESIAATQTRHDGEFAAVRRDQQLTREDVGALRTEHASTRAWVEAEAAERRAITRGVEQLAGALDTHIVYAKRRDEQIAELQAVIIDPPAQTS